MEIVVLAIVVAAVVYFAKSYGSYEKSGMDPHKVHFENAYDELLHTEYGIIVALTAKVAKADGHIGELEAELISLMLNDVSGEFDNASEMRAAFKAIYQKEQESFENTIYLAKEFTKLSRRDPSKRMKVLEHLMNLAFIDGVVTKQEGMIVGDIAGALEINPKAYHKMYDNFEQYYAQRKTAKSEHNIADDYKLLGISEGAEFSEVKKAYRALVKKNHPDVIKGQGFGDDIVKEATEKLQEINAAYENIKKAQGK